jgi:hypothetical protein
LGGGPGTIAIPLSFTVAEAVAVDPNAAMIAERPTVGRIEDEHPVTTVAGVTRAMPFDEETPRSLFAVQPADHDRIANARFPSRFYSA